MGDSREGQDGWRYMLAEEYLTELLARVHDGEDPTEVMFELWSEAEEAA